MASEQHIRIVTHHGDLVIFQCKHFMSKGSEIISWRVSFNQESGIFSKKNDNITLVYKTSRKVDMVHCDTSINAKTKQKIPCILLRLCKRGSQGFKYMLFSLNSSNSAYLHVGFSLPYEMADISILHGPTLVWNHKDTVFYLSSEAAVVKEIPIDMKINFIGTVPLCQRPLGIIGSHIVPQEDRFNSGGEPRTLLYLIEDGRTFSGCCFFPEPYSSVIQCLVVLSAVEVGGSLRSSTIAATSKKQLLYFENGLPDKVCILPYEDPRSIQVAHTGTVCLIVIRFEHRNACAVEKDTFKVVACWTGVHHLFVDDFVAGGFDQLLLVFEEECLADEIFGKFFLTDLSGIHYSLGITDQETLNGREIAEENMIFLIQALNSRLQNGLLFLQDLQRDLHVKDRVIQQCVSALRDHLANRKHIVSPTQQEELVCLLDEQSEENEYTPEDRIMVHSNEQFSKVEKIWYRIVGKNLVCGILLTSTDQISMGWETLITAVLASSPVTESQATILHYPEPVNSMSGHSSAKRNKLPTGQAVFIVTDLASLLTFEPRSFSVLIYFPCNGTGTPSQHCELVNLDLKRVLAVKLCPQLLENSSYDESIEDLLSLMATFKSWYFCIRSTDHTLVDVAGILEEHFAAKRIKAYPHYLVSRSTQPTSATLYHWKVCGFFEGLLEFYCSDHLGLLSFLDTLHSFLPSSHHIELLKYKRTDQQNPTLFMETEILWIKQAMAALVCVEPEESIEKGKHGTGLHITRECWHRERSGSHLRPHVEAQLYREAVERVINVKMNSDVAALIEGRLSDS